MAAATKLLPGARKVRGLVEGYRKLLNWLSESEFDGTVVKKRTSGGSVWYFLNPADTRKAAASVHLLGAVASCHQGAGFQIDKFAGAELW